MSLLFRVILAAVVVAAQAPSTDPRLTHHGVILGTACYMAPEQARAEPVDRGTDIWAFGVTLYEMLTGEQAFAGKVIERMQGPNGAIAHAEVKIGDSIVMLGEANERAKAYAATLYHYVTNVDETHRRAIAAGANVLTEPVDMFYGDRSGAVIDPFGNSWYIATHIEDVSPEEMQKRMQAMRK